MKHLLVVEDEPRLRALYQLELEAEGYEVDTAADAHEALQKIEEQKTDVVILDLKLPGKSGLELLREIIVLAPRSGVIINTAYDIYRYDFTSWGADAFLIKSSDLTDLKRSIARFVRGAQNENLN